MLSVLSSTLVFLYFLRGDFSRRLKLRQTGNVLFYKKLEMQRKTWHYVRKKKEDKKLGEVKLC